MIDVNIKAWPLAETVVERSGPSLWEVVTLRLPTTGTLIEFSHYSLMVSAREAHKVNSSLVEAIFRR